MDKNFRRALYTALVAGGLVVVGATAAYAAADAPRDAVAQGAPEATEGAASTDGASVATLSVGTVEAPSGFPGSTIWRPQWVRVLASTDPAFVSPPSARFCNAVSAIS